MAEKIKDAEDRLLDSLFASERIADDGFSQKIVRRIKRRLWIRRLTIPAAIAIGAMIALPPLLGLLRDLQGLLGVLPLSRVQSVIDAVPQMQTLLMGAVLLVVGLIGAQLLQD